MSNLGKKLKWGVLGTGRICNKVVPAIQNAPSSIAYSIASRDPKKAEEAAKKFGISKIAESYEALIQDKDIDVIYIPLPNALHVEWVVKAAQEKKHILCEKPLGINLEETRTALQACKANNVKIMEGYMWPHHPRTKVLKKIIHERLGTIQHVNTALDFQLTSDHSKIRRTSELGGGALFDVGCYCVQGILWALDELPSNVYAAATFENGIDTEMTTLLSFPSKKTAAFHCGFKNTYRGFLEVVGSDAVLRVPQMWNPFSNTSAEIWASGELKETIAFEKTDQILSTVENFNRHILFDEKLPNETGMTENILKVVDALYESAWTEERVPVLH